MVNFIIVLLAIVILYEFGRLLFCLYLVKIAGRKTTPIENYPANPVGRILILGDSTSYGTGALNSDNSLVGRLIKDYPNYTVINKSQNGLRFSQLEKQLTTLADINNLDYIFLHIGGMDTLYFTSQATIKKVFDKFAKFCFAKKVRQCFVVSVNNTGNVPMYHFPLNYLLGKRSHVVSDQLNKLAQNYGFVSIPLYENKALEPLLSSSDLFSADKIHPNDKGYGKWYEKIHSASYTYLKQ